MSRRRPCWSRRRGMPQLHRQHRQQRRRRQAGMPQLPGRLCLSRRRGLSQLHRQQRQNFTRRRLLPSLRSSAHIATNFVGTNAASGANCTRCARNVCRCTSAINALGRELVLHRVSKGLGLISSSSSSRSSCCSRHRLQNLSGDRRRQSTCRSSCCSSRRRLENLPQQVQQPPQAPVRT